MFITGTAEKHKCQRTSMFKTFLEIWLFKRNQFEASLKPVCGPNMNNTEHTFSIVHAGFTCARSAEVCTLW